MDDFEEAINEMRALSEVSVHWDKMGMNEVERC